MLVWCCCSQYSESDRVILLSVECPVICQMQQLLVSMVTMHGPFSVFSSSLCGGKAAGGRRKWWCSENGESGALIACLYERGQVPGESRDREV